MKLPNRRRVRADDRVYAIVIGAMRSGTSTLFAHLSEHPAICPSTVKEPEYFSERQGHRISARAYEDLWQYDADRHRVCLEASTGYTKYPHETGVPRRMAEYGLEPKFIYLLRDPIERIVSQRDFEGLRLGVPEDYTLTDDRLVAPSLYHTQLEQFLNHFPDKDRYLILDFEDLKTAPEIVVRRCFEFLGLPRQTLKLTPSRVNRTPYPGVLEGHFRNSRLGTLAGRLTPNVNRRIQRLLRKLSPPAKPNIGADERQRLHRLLSEDMKRLRAEFGVEIRRWGFES